MSKAHDPHWRYIAFVIEQPSAVDRAAVASALRRIAPPDQDPIQLTRYAFPHGIAKMHHHQVDAVKQSLSGTLRLRVAGVPSEVGVRTLSTSGTIRSLTDRLGILVKRA